MLLGKHVRSAASLFGVSSTMKFATFAAALLPLVNAYTKEQYDSGEVMAKMMEAKEVFISIPDASGFH